MARQIKPRVRSKKIGVFEEESRFTDGALLRMSKDLHSGRNPKERDRFRDDVVVGLYATINRSGLITFHIDYEIEGDRHHLTLGALNEERDDRITIDEARKLANIVKILARGKINPQDGLHKRLIKELKRDGTAWKPK